MAAVDDPILVREITASFLLKVVKLLLYCDFSISRLYILLIYVMFQHTPPPQKKEQFGQSKAFRVAEAMHKHKVQHEKLMNSA